MKIVRRLMNLMSALRRPRIDTELENNKRLLGSKEHGNRPRPTTGVPVIRQRFFWEVK
jgi:hypothetical protein